MGSFELERSFVDLSRAQAQRYAAKRAYVFLADGSSEAGVLTYKELDLKARALSAAIRLRSCAGDRALILCHSSLEYVVSFFGCLYAGVIAVPAYPPRAARTEIRIRHIVEDCSPTTVLTTSFLSERVRSFLGFLSTPPLIIEVDQVSDAMADQWRMSELTGNTLAMLQYTSGSVFDPRGVKVSHGNLMANQRMIQTAMGHSNESDFASWLPPYHDMGLIGNLLQPFYVGASCVFMPPVAFITRPARWLEAITKYGTHTSGAPNFAYDLCTRAITEDERKSLDLSAWRVAYNGAEPVDADVLDRFSRMFSGSGFSARSWFPCYGLAEATLLVAGGEKDVAPKRLVADRRKLEKGKLEVDVSQADARTLVGCGMAVEGGEIRIVDPVTATESVPGEIGEIWVSGPHVALAYWENTGETETTFNGYIGDSKEGPFLRTGDLGAVHGGELFILGRLKEVLIIDGRNLFPRDIEIVSGESLAGIEPAGIAAAVLEEDGCRDICLFVEVGRKWINRLPTQEVFKDVAENLLQTLGVSIDRLVFLAPGKMPRTTSGKLQRRLCARKYRDQELSTLAVWKRNRSLALGEFDSRSPSGLESWLLRLIALASQLPEETCRFLCFSEMGLDSLRAIEVLHQIERDTGVLLQLSILYGDMSIAGLAAEILRHRAAPAAAAIQANSCDERMSAGQEALWFSQQLAPRSAAFNVSWGIRFRGSFDEAAFRQIISDLCAQQSILRAVFPVVDGRPKMRFHDAVEVIFPLDLRAGDDGIHTCIARLTSQPFDLETDNLFRIHLIRDKGDEVVVLFVVHHIVIDLWSAVLLTGEILSRYEQSTCGSTVASSSLSKESFSEFVSFQEETLEKRGAGLWSFWRASIPENGSFPSFAIDDSFARNSAGAGCGYRFSLPGSVLPRLSDLAKRIKTSKQVLLLTVYCLWLRQVTCQDEHVVGLMLSGRSRERFSRMLGYFSNPCPIHIDVKGGRSFRNLAEDLKRKVLAAIECQDYPFSLMVKNFSPSRVPGRVPLIQTMFVHHQLPVYEELAGCVLGREDEFRFGSLSLQSISIDKQTSRYDLTLYILEVNGRLEAEFVYHPGVFNSSTIERLSSEYIALSDALFDSGAPNTA